MGMFDRFIIDKNCPCCGNPIKEIQTKHFGCELNEWKQFQKIDFGQGMFIERGYLWENIYCSNKDCEVTDNYSAKITIEDGRFIAIDFI